MSELASQHDTVLLQQKGEKKVEWGGGKKTEGQTGLGRETGRERERRSEDRKREIEGQRTLGEGRQKQKHRDRDRAKTERESILYYYPILFLKIQWGTQFVFFEEILRNERGTK